MPHFTSAKSGADQVREDDDIKGHWLFEGVMSDVDYKSARERLENRLDKKPALNLLTLAEQSGAMKFCDYLRGKVEANTLLVAWDNFSRQEGFL